MAEEDEAAGAAGRLEQALDRIEKAASVKLRGDMQDHAKVQIVAQRLDELIADLRAALAEGRHSDLG